MKICTSQSDVGKFHRRSRWSLAVERIYLFFRNWPGLIGIILATLIVKLTYEMEQLRCENTIQFFACAMCKVYFILKRTRQVSKLLTF